MRAVIIKGYDLYFPTCLPIVENYVGTPSVEAMFTPYGFLIPITANGVNVLDFLDNSYYFPGATKDPGHGVLVTADGIVRSFVYKATLNDDRTYGHNVLWQRRLMGPDSCMAITDDVSDVQIINSLLRLHSEPFKALEVLRDSVPFNKGEYTSMSLVDICNGLNDRGFTFEAMVKRLSAKQPGKNS